MLQAITTGFAYGGLAKITTDINLEGSLFYASSNVILRQLAWKVGDELLGQTEVALFIKTIFVTATSFHGGIYISRMLGNRLTKQDVSMLSVDAMFISTFICCASMYENHLIG